MARGVSRRRPTRGCSTRAGGCRARWPISTATGTSTSTSPATRAAPSSISSPGTKSPSPIRCGASGRGFEVVERFAEHYELAWRADGVVRLEKGESDELYLNEGGGRFRHVPFSSGAFLDPEGAPLEAAPTEWGLAARFGDLDSDGDPGPLRRERPAQSRPALDQSGRRHLPPAASPRPAHDERLLHGGGFLGLRPGRRRGCVRARHARPATRGRGRRRIRCRAWSRRRRARPPGRSR